MIAATVQATGSGASSAGSASIQAGTAEAEW